MVYRRPGLPFLTTGPARYWGRIIGHPPLACQVQKNPHPCLVYNARSSPWLTGGLGKPGQNGKVADKEAVKTAHFYRFGVGVACK